MITKFMTLNIATDADFWAGEILEGTQYSESEHEKLSDWIWNNKPNLNCTYDEHPISQIDFDDVLDIIN